MPSTVTVTSFLWAPLSPTYNGGTVLLGLRNNRGDECKVLDGMDQGIWLVLLLEWPGVLCVDRGNTPPPSKEESKSGS